MLHKTHRPIWSGPRLGLQDIQIRLLPAETMYKHYIENTKMDISILEL